MPLSAPLFEGPIDVVGDVHGEVDVLRGLLAALGYDRHGDHPAGRRLVFVGDLCDRGPDSPAVVQLVAGLARRGVAQCVLGNHELSLLRRKSKHGNRWFIDPAHPEQRGEFASSRAATDDQRAAALAFFGGLPLTLERADLRVVHAAWHAPSLAALAALELDTPLAAFDHFEATIAATLAGDGLEARAAAELARHPIHDRAAPPPFLPAVARRDELLQQGNPVRVVTSGLERTAAAPFWASGKWRMVDRVRWWRDYDDPIPVVIGHYWRVADAALSGNKPDVFDGAAHDAWHGPRHNVFCVDFSIGGRYRERSEGRARFATRLAAVRWPERELVFDDGERTSLTTAL